MRLGPVEDCPDGYPRLGAFLSSDQNFTLYRGFSYLHSRVLLDLQVDLARLERELDRRDKEDEANGDRRRLRCLDRDRARGRSEERSRQTILAEIKSKLVEYGQ